MLLFIADRLPLLITSEPGKIQLGRQAHAATLFLTFSACTSREGSPPGVAEGGLLLHTIPLGEIETVTQRSTFLAGNPLLVIQVRSCA